MQIRPEFVTALKDYLFLLENKYPQKATLKLVSDRYRLNSVERSLLFRGVVISRNRQLRQAKTTEQLPSSGLISIDGFNVLRTVASYLLGRPIFMAMDGFLRDASEMHGKPLKLENRLHAFDLVMDTLKNKALEVHFWFDAPVSYSGETASAINEKLKSLGIKGKAEVVRSADHVLKQVQEGVVATADSAIIESAHVPAVDLAKITLLTHFKPEFTDLRKLTGKEDQPA